MEKNFAKNLPLEIRNSSRFFAVGTAENPKAPKVKNWSNPDNQTTWDYIDGAVGFDTCGHDKTPDICFLDFDHVLKDNGEFVNKHAEKTVSKLQNTFENIYIEKSISGHGLHAFLKPTAEKFEMLAAGSKATVYFSDSREKDAPKLEIFYKTKARYCLVTGDIYGTGAEIPSGETADKYLKNLLAIVASQTEREKEIKSVIKSVSKQDTPPEYIHDLALELWQFGNFADAERGDWLPCISALKNLSFSYSEIKSMCEHSARYNENAFDSEFNSLTDISNFGIETLIGKCPAFDFKAFARNWYNEHQQFKSDSKNFYDDEIQSLKAELQTVEKQIAEFTAETERNITGLTELETFDSETVFSDKVLMQAAFAKIFNRQVFSEFKKAVQIFKKKHPEKGVGLPDLSAAIKDFEEEIKSRRTDLFALRTKIKSKIETLHFKAANDDILGKFNIPEDYVISDENGVEKIGEKEVTSVCRLPLIITEKFKSVEDETYKYILTYKENGKWKKSPPTPASVIFNQSKIANLADFDLPVTSVNAYKVVDFLDAFKTENSRNFPLTQTLRRGGWYNFNGRDYFLDPRRNCEYTGKNGDFCRVIVEDNYFTKGLATSGNFEKWRQAYDLIKNYPVARFIVAASIAAPLLHILGERTFIFYVYGKTTSGKTTALKLGASLFGNIDKVVRNFNGTTKGLAELAAVVNDYSLLIDEKQGADERLRDNLIQLIYNYAEGQGRTRLDSNANLKDVENWRMVAVMNGETPLHDDNVTAGSFTRVLSLALTEKVLPPDICADIWDNIKNNYGFAFSPYIDQLLNYGFDNLHEKYKEIVENFTKNFPNILPEYCRYMAVITLADTFLNVALGIDKTEGLENAVIIADKIFPLVPTKTEIDDTAREIDFVKSFIVRFSAHFKGNLNFNPSLELFGERDDTEGYLFIINTVLNEYCIKAGYNSKKFANDLAEKNFFVPADNIEKGKKPRNTIVKRINGDSTRCYRIRLETINVTV